MAVSFQSFILSFFLAISLCISFSCKKKTGEVIDKKGVPYYVYNDIGKQRNPLFIAAKALNYYALYKKGNDSLEQPFFNCIHWLEQNLKVVDTMATLPYSFYLKAYDLQPPWSSGLANSRAIRAFVKAHEHTKDKKYLDLCNQLLNSFMVPTEKGGVLTHLSDGNWWYAEYASTKKQSPHVLNGMVSEINAIQIYYDYYPIEKAKLLIEKGHKTLQENLYRFNNNGLSYYDLDSNVASESYHKMHVRQMSELFNTTNDSIYWEFHKVWKEYYNLNYASSGEKLSNL